MNDSQLYEQLNAQQRTLVDALMAEHGDKLQRQAMLEILLEPGYEEAFIQRYFGDKIDTKLEDFHMRLIKTALYEKRGLVLFPAQHGKTTIISTILPILEVIRNPDIRIAIIAKNDDEAAAIMSAIKAELEQNDQLIQDYGPFRPEPNDPIRSWSASGISTARRARRGKEHAITVFGAGSRQILGWRTDWVICDDVVTEKNSATEDQRAKHVTWYNDCVETSPQKRRPGEVAGRITTVGTMFHPRDLYASITEKKDRKGEPRYKCHREDAIRDWEKQETLWPAVWSWDDMMDIKQAEGTLSFNKRYRNKPVDEKEQPFREDWLRGGGEMANGQRHPGCLNPNRVMGDIQEARDNGWRIYSTLDPAVGKTRSAKGCGYLIVGVDPADPKRRYIIDISRDQMSLPAQRDLIIDNHLLYDMVMSVTEENAYQAGLNQSIQDECDRRGVTIRVEGHTTGKNKQDPEIGIPSISVVVENALLDIPYGNAESIRKAELWLDELIEYPFFRFTDITMAFWFIHLKLNTGIPFYRSTNRLHDRSRYRKTNGRRGMVKNPYYEMASRRVEGQEGSAEPEALVS